MMFLATINLDPDGKAVRATYTPESERMQEVVAHLT